MGKKSKKKNQNQIQKRKIEKKRRHEKRKNNLTTAQNTKSAVSTDEGDITNTLDKKEQSPSWFSSGTQSLDEHIKILNSMDSMPIEKIIEMLRSFGVDFHKEQFEKDVHNFLSASEMHKYWETKYTITTTGRDDDFIWRAIDILWRRLVPKVINSEQIDEMMQNGYDIFEEGDSLKACTLWLKVWEHLKKRFKPNMLSIEDAEQVFNGTQSLFNWCQDLESELHNAGLDNRSFHKKRIQYCQEFTTLFPKTDQLTLHNMKRAIAEAYSHLGLLKEADTTFQALVEEFPDNAWSYIGWGDMYANPPHKKIPYNRKKAEQIYKMGLEKAKEDKIDIRGRIGDLEKEN